MPMKPTVRRWVEVVLAGGALASLAVGQRTPGAPTKPVVRAGDLPAMRRTFAEPPMDARPMMRWWWFGPAVERTELARELRAMKAGGIGGAEIQPVYPLELDDPQKGFRNMRFLSPEFLNMVGFAAKTGEDLGMRMSLTLGSGWPYGGEWVPVTESAGRLRVVVIQLVGAESSVPAPPMENGEELLATFLAAGTEESYDAEHAQMVSAGPDGRLNLPEAHHGAQVALFFIAGRTGQQVKRPAVGAEGFVIDHFSREAVADHLRNVGDPLVRAFGDHPPYSVFSDSLEVYGSDWTPELLSEFRNRRGYDLTPLLPEMIAGTNEEAADLRYDWARTLAELIDANYLEQIDAWARSHRTKFRSQSYGIPAVTLSSNRLVDLPEGEGSQWHGPFSYTRWATSASHIYGRPVTSAETWTWLHSPPFRATPLDMKAEADTFFLQGVNQLMGHGWPYSPPPSGEPGHSFYAAGVFNDQNPWWIVMPDVTAYLTRISWLLRQGQPSSDVAVLLPEEDAQARFRPGAATVSDQMGNLLGPELTSAILDAGYNYDFVDAQAIDRAGIPFRVLVIPGLERLPLETYRRIAEYASRGGVVIATGHAPARAPGFIEGLRDSAGVRAISQQLFAPTEGNTRLVPDAKDIGATLATFLRPDMSLHPAAPEVSFIHRRLPDADLYFVANTDNRPHSFSATFRTDRKAAEWWDPFTGSVTGAGEAPSIAMSLAPYESRLVVFAERAVTVQAAKPASFAPIDLSRDWKVIFDKSGAAETMPMLRWWSEDEREKYYSGTVTYARSVEIPDEVVRAGAVILDFGEGTPAEKRPSNLPGMRAWYDAPLRDAAVVYVNGKRAGSVWHPPYRIDLGPLLHTGPNELKIVVANTAINELAGRALQDYSLLWEKYGKRFAPQDMDHLEPLPSGIAGPLRLIPNGYTAFPAERWLMLLGQEVARYQIDRDGPIIAVQMEIKYGDFGSDPEYLQHLRTIFQKAGFADGCVHRSDVSAQAQRALLVPL
jgi:hypothetical protein